MLVKVDIEEINRTLSSLVERKEDLLLEEIPELLRQDFSNFMYGQTITRRNGKIYYYYNDFLKWIWKKYRDVEAEV